MTPTPTNPTTTPIDCPESGCTWVVRGVPDKYARILARDHAAEHARQARRTEVVPDGGLRDRIAVAVRTVPIKYGDDTIEPVSVDEAAVLTNAVLAVLPTGADRADLPDRLQAVLTERFTALGNPFSEMRTQEKGPDGWPASHPVGPAGVAEVLRELLAAEQPTPTERAAIARVRAVLETEAVTGRTALEYRGLITGALMAAEAQQPAPAETEEPTP